MTIRLGGPGKPELVFPALGRGSMRIIDLLDMWNTEGSWAALELALDVAFRNI